MVLGLALLMMSRAIADGAHEQWIGDGVRLGPGHVAVEAPGYLRSGSLTDRLDSAQVAEAEAALGDRAVAARMVASAVQLGVSALASSPGSAVPVQVMGVDPAREASFSALDRKRVEGRYLRSSDRLAAYIGVSLAERLGLRIGSRLVVSAQDASGQIADQLLRVVGTFRTGIPELDEGLVHVPIATAREWLRVPGGATRVAVLLQSSRDVPAVIRDLRPRLDGGVRVLSWREASPELDSAVRIDDFGDYVFHAILFGIIALAVLNAVLMSVLNRTREFGVLEALGLTKRETGAVVFTEGLLLTLLSGLLGVALGFGVTWGFFRHGLDLSALYSSDITLSGAVVSPIIVPIFRPAQVLQSVAFIMLIGVLASLYPARQAMRIDVAEAMKFDR